MIATNSLSSLMKLCFWAAILTVFTVCLIPIDAQGPINHFDKFVHFFSFSILTVLCFWAYPATSKRKNTRLHIQAIAICAFGMFIEIAQSFTPYRFFSWLDFLADSAGVLVIWLIYLRFVIPNGREKTDEHPSNI